MQLLALIEAGVRQLVDAAGSAFDPEAVFSRTGGNPFHGTEALASGAEPPVALPGAVCPRLPPAAVTRSHSSTEARDTLPITNG